jgi:hypothetical protein
MQREGDAGKVAIAERLRRRMTMTLAWTTSFPFH